jgi:hypothetical protein
MGFLMAFLQAIPQAIGMFFEALFSTKRGWALIVGTILLVVLLAVAAIAVTIFSPENEVRRFIDTPLKPTSEFLNAEPAAPNAELIACVDVDSLWFRDGPGEDFNKVDGFIRGDCFVIDGISRDGNWVKISETLHWVAVQFLDIQELLEDLPIVD